MPGLDRRRAVALGWRRLLQHLRQPRDELRIHAWADGVRILAAIIYWQIREIDRVLSEAGSDADDLNFELLSHISPIGWDNVLLYGEYQLNRSLVRSERLSV